mgnify:FL=1
MASTRIVQQRAGLYNWYVLTVLTLTYLFNFVDRSIVPALAESIKADLRLNDLQLGLLTGLAFAVLYTFVSVPFARFADHYNRVQIISVSVLSWSVMTAICAITQNFTQLVLARAGVGIGEAGSTPASLSVLADYFPRQQRATATAIFSMGIPLGIMCGSVVSGIIAQRFGWRLAFAIVGAPGIILSAISYFTLREPERGTQDGKDLRSDGVSSLVSVLRVLVNRTSLRYACLAGTLLSISTYGISNFYVPFLMRGFGLALAKAASTFGIVFGVTALVGMWIGGSLGDVLSKYNRRFYGWIPGSAILCAVPLLVLAFSQDALYPSIVYFGVANLLVNTHLGPMWALVHDELSADMRATGVSIFLLLFTLVGLGTGPLIVGALSDIFAKSIYAAASINSAICSMGAFHPGEKSGMLCLAGSFRGLRYAMMCIVLFTATSSFCFFLSSRRKGPV